MMIGFGRGSRRSRYPRLEIKMLSRMSAVQAFSAFVSLALTPARATRYSGLANRPKGQKRVLDSLYHDFERAIRPDAKRRAVDRRARCYAYHSSLGFGAEFPSVAEAYSKLGSDDGWLIIVSDGSAGIYRPESRWDAAVEIAG